MTEHIKLRRTLHYVPGNNPQRLNGVVKLPVDIVVIDLEDSVSAAGKVEAREQVVQAVPGLDFGPREVVVRINALDTAWGEADLAAVAGLPISGVLLPKSESAETVQKAAAVLDALGAGNTLALWCQIETPRGVLRAEEIAAAHPRVTAFVIGGADLVETLHARDTALRLPLLNALSHTVLVARAYGLAAIDAVHPNRRNDDGFAESCQQAVELGFDGKSISLVHQLPAANAAFGPDADAVEQARQIISAAAEGADGSGYQSLHLAHARRLVALADVIEAKRIAFG